MLDLIYLIGGIAFFAGASMYVAFCDRVVGGGRGEADNARGPRRDQT